MKKLKFKIKGWLLVKLAKARKETNIYKEKVAKDLIVQQELYDTLNEMKIDIRELLFKLSEEDRKNWLKKKGKKNERYIFEEKPIKK